MNKRCVCVFHYPKEGGPPVVESCGYHYHREELIRRMKLIGDQMANLCFNGKQDDILPDDFRETMTKLQKEWDALK